MRWLLVLVLINGLAPGVAGAAEAAVHYASTGHVGHSPGEDDRSDRGAEHSCGVVFHQCGCCSAMVATAEEHAPAGLPLAPSSGSGPSTADRVATRSLEPPFRPPIR